MAKLYGKAMNRRQHGGEDVSSKALYSHVIEILNVGRQAATGVPIADIYNLRAFLAFQIWLSPNVGHEIR